MLGFEIDFPKYVANRLSNIKQRARDGAAYAYTGEARTRRALISAKPVAMAIEGTSRLWKNKARGEIQQKGTQINDETYPKLWAALEKAGAALGLGHSKTAYAVDGVARGAQALGTDDDALIIVDREIASRLNEEELCALFARELGHIQNNHTIFVTCLHYLQKDAVFFVRWIVQPALLALKAWSRRAEITCDRAALIAVQDLATFVSMELKVSGEKNPEAQTYLDELPGATASRVSDLFKTHPMLPIRIHALKAFQKSRYYLGVRDESTENAEDALEIDAKITELLSAF